MSLSQAKGDPKGVTNGLSFHSDTTREKQDRKEKSGKTKRM